MPAGGAHRLEARSQELTKNLVHTRNLLEGNFKSFKRRDRDFQLQKLANFEEELKAKARIERESRPPELHRTKSSEASRGSTVRSSSSTAPAKLKRYGSAPSELSPFPETWGGHGVMPKPPGSPAAFPLAVSRYCADTPASLHPPPHPGSLSMNPAGTRSMKAFTTTYGVPTPPMVKFPRSPGGQLLVPKSSDATPGTSRKEGLGETSGETCEMASDKDPMIKRLGEMMALLGPRYKTISREMLWEKAQRGERTALQRRREKLGIELKCQPDTSLRTSASAPGSLAQDSDGRARASWLAARETNRDRRSNTARGMS